MPDLKLIAFDAEDISVISAHLQDAVIRVSDMAWLPREHRFVMIANRFDWAEAISAGQVAHAKPGANFIRRRSALRFERVTGAQLQGIDLKSRKTVLALLAIAVEQTAADDPSGHVTLSFAGGGAIRLAVECVEAELKDLGAAWSTKTRPDHPDETGSG